MRLLLIPQAIGLFCRRRKETRTTATTKPVPVAEERRAKGQVPLFHEKREEEGAGEISLFLDGLERESILGSEARFLSALKEIYFLLPRVGTVDSWSREIERIMLAEDEVKRVGRDARRKDGRTRRHTAGHENGNEGGRREGRKEGRK